MIASKCMRETLHVQSISFWAAANIGPYAQANTIGNIVFIAGQIGLTPNTMQLPPLLGDQIQTSLYNLKAITMEMKSFHFGAVCYITDPKAYSEVFSEWNNRSILLTVCCSGLPRSALVEWQTLNLKNMLITDMAIEELGTLFYLISDSDNNNQYTWKIRLASAGESHVAIGTFSCDSEDAFSNGIASFADSLDDLGCSIYRVFYTPSVDFGNLLSVFERKSMNLAWIPVTWIEGDSQIGIIAYDLQ